MLFIIILITNIETIIMLIEIGNGVFQIRLIIV